jgi:hypothetical protein
MGKRNDSWRDLEMGYYVDEKRKDQPLAALFRNDGVAAALAGHLHYNDIVNTSLVSKSLRSAIFVSPEGGASNRLDMLCEKSCTSGEKRECWACARLICNVSSLHSFASSQPNHLLGL